MNHAQLIVDKMCAEEKERLKVFMRIADKRYMPIGQQKTDENKHILAAIKKLHDRIKSFEEKQNNIIKLLENFSRPENNEQKQ